MVQPGTGYSSRGGIYRDEQFAPQSGETFTSQADEPSADLDFKEIVERLVVQNLNRGSGHEAEFLPVSQPFGIVVLSLADDHGFAGAELGDSLQIAAEKLAGPRRDRMPVRVFERLAEVVRDRLFEPRRDGVFQRLRLGIHLAPIELQHLREE